ncbi:hypothetical protein J3D55_001676 [Chryseobacterium ginsenosidimutans]|uniref:PorT family protein n=1 Tax=Chryseobacterium ginsenosidimutans TaxID=687846 RepID=UPI00216A25DA|nr:PorT family protein [Chryseobacterium ginsenosidimutans]MCS3868760.1 hypothetical protein [Chryseobacterium ginsenosidimutans]
MKKISLFAGLVSVCLFNAQIKFEKGYFIDNSGQRSDVLIKNLDWKNNPTEFEYKTESSSDIKKENIKNIQEFGVDQESKYIRKTVLIDYSSEILDKISQERKPEFKEATVFLKYLVEGKADLFFYENNDIQKLFFSVDDSNVKQLVYKSYYLTNSQITYNEDYKNQLTENLNCGIDGKQIQKLKYQPNDLTKVFMSYNACSNGTNTVNYNQVTEKKDLFNLNIRPGINFSNLKTISSSYYYADEVTKFDREVSFRIGLEAEFILPFNKNKWAIFAEPTYQYYKSETESIVYPGQFFEAKSTRSTDYKSIEVPFGIRHYFFLNDKSKVFINAAYVFDFQINSKIQYDYQTLNINSGNNLVFGIGYKYNDKFSAEFRASTNRNILQNYNNWTSKYQTMSLILGYTLF